MGSTTVSVGISARAYGTRPNVHFGTSKSLAKVYSLNKANVVTKNNIDKNKTTYTNSVSLMKNGFVYGPLPSYQNSNFINSIKTI